MEEVAIAKAFFRQYFAELANQPDVPDAFVQQELLQWLKATPSQNREPAE